MRLISLTPRSSSSSLISRLTAVVDMLRSRAAADRLPSAQVRSNTFIAARRFIAAPRPKAIAALRSHGRPH